MNAYRQSGLSLVELLIATFLGLLLVTAMVSLFLQTRSNFQQNDRIAGLHDHAQFALSQLARDLLMAGYWGGIYRAEDVQVSPAATAAAPVSDCGSGWTFDVTKRTAFYNNVDSNLSTAFPCLDVSTVVAGTDVLAVRRVAGQPSAEITAAQNSATLIAQHVFLQTNGTAGTLIHTGGFSNYSPAAPIVPYAGAMAFYLYTPHVYFIRSYTLTPDDGTPALCRLSLNHAAALSYETECVAEGVEDMQVIWGIDSDADQVADRYTDAPDAGDLARARTAQVFLLVRTTESDANFSESGTYDLGTKTVTRSGDNFRRRVFTTTVELRNG